MPFIRTSVKKGTSDDIRTKIVKGIHRALVDSIGMPEEELFNIVSEYESTHFYYDRTFNGFSRSDSMIAIEISLRRGRSDAMKRDLYHSITTNLENGAGISPKDVFIFMHENDYSDWSVGGGQFAMAIVQQRGSD